MRQYEEDFEIKGADKIMGQILLSRNSAQTPPSWKRLELLYLVYCLLSEVKGLLSSQISYEKISF